MIEKTKKIFFPFLLLIIFLYILPFNFVFASDKLSLPSITVINLVRGNELGHEKDDLYLSLKDQFEVTKKLEVNATWLLQYSILENKEIVNFAKSTMKNQEFGLLFEIDRNSAQKGHVQYRGQGPWYFSDGLFLVSYDKDERKRLIDTSFAKFKEMFGYYPKTVGAWWIGGDSVSYMQERYGITAVLRASDQFDLDFYSIWGTPWSMPYVSSKQHQGIPAKSFDESSKVVNLQWAARDPVEGYEDPLFSLQDYQQKGYDSKYVNHLFSIYLKHPNDNSVIGLENGGTLAFFEKFYKTMLTEAKKLETEKKVNIELARDFSKGFLSQKKIFSKTPYFLANDFDSNNQSFWYNSENYRAGVKKEGNNIYLIDLRDYSNKTEEDFTFLPNSQSRLRINTPSIIDSMRFPEDKMLILKDGEPMKIKEENGNVYLFSGSRKIANFEKKNLEIIFSDGVKSFNFSSVKDSVNPSFILISVYLVYLLVLYLKKINFKELSFSLIALLIPFLLAMEILKSGSGFAFDKKELMILQFFPIGYIPSVENSLFLMKIIFLAILLISHYIFYISSNTKRKRVVYFLILGFITLLFINIPYFPLDASTYKIVFLIVGFICISLIVLLSVLFLKTKSKKFLKMSVIFIPFFLLSLFLVLVLSRSIYILSPFEIDALEFIKIQNKNVYYISQVDYSIYPIYKRIRPLIYYEIKFAEKLTGKSWVKVVRPENNIIKLTNYDDKLIVVPRYLGADISSYEIESLKIKRIFDNVQIAIYEKE